MVKTSLFAKEGAPCTFTSLSPALRILKTPRRRIGDPVGTAMAKQGLVCAAITDSVMYNYFHHTNRDYIFNSYYLRNFSVCSAVCNVILT